MLQKKYSKLFFFLYKSLCFDLLFVLISTPIQSSFVWHVFVSGWDTQRRSHGVDPGGPAPSQSNVASHC